MLRCWLFTLRSGWSGRLIVAPPACCGQPSLSAGRQRRCLPPRLWAGFLLNPVRLLLRRRWWGKKVPKRKTKTKKEKQHQQEKEGDQDVAMGEATTMDNLTANLPPGGSLAIGDLSEFGVEDGVLSIPGSGRPSSSPPVSGLGKGCSGSKGVVAGEGLGTASVAPLAALGGPLGREDVQAGRATSSLSPPASVVSSSGGQRFRCQSCRSWHHERFFAFTPNGARSKFCRKCSDNWEGFES